MMFRAQNLRVIAVSQPMHAWISGLLLRACAESFAESALIAAEQHDIAWLDWETAPTFDAATGRPQFFLDLGGAAHAPMWAKGVERAFRAWGAHVALLLSRHGSGVYTRFADRYAVIEADARATRFYLETQAEKQTAWAMRLGVDARRLDWESGWLVFVDTLSLALCGALKAPMELRCPARDGAPMSMWLTQSAEQPDDFRLAPWPFRQSELNLEGEGLVMPDGGRFADEGAMRLWLDAAERTAFRARLTPG